MADHEPGLRCIERPLEYMDAQILAALLRANAIHAFVFDENFVRQNWLHVLAYGGFRVVVAAEQAAEADRVISDFRSGVLQLRPEPSLDPECPHCSCKDTEPDPRPRRFVFMALIITCMIAFFPSLVRRLIYGRFRCRRCRTSWREPRSAPFAKQQQDAEIALAGAP